MERDDRSGAPAIIDDSHPYIETLLPYMYRCPLYLLSPSPKPTCQFGKNRPPYYPSAILPSPCVFHLSPQPQHSIMTEPGPQLWCILVDHRLDHTLGEPIPVEVPSGSEATISALKKMSRQGRIPNFPTSLSTVS